MCFCCTRTWPRARGKEEDEKQPGKKKKFPQVLYFKTFDWLVFGTNDDDNDDDNNDDGDDDDEDNDDDNNNDGDDDDIGSR